MIEAATVLSARATELRTDFDRAFASPVRVDAIAKHDLIAIRVGTEPCAIRLSEITGLFADRQITRVPGGKSALLGIAGFRGAVVPVYGLPALLGQSGAPPPRWLVIAVAAPVALAFDAFEAHLRVPADAILPRQSRGHTHGFAPEFIRSGDLVRPVIHLPSVIDALGTTKAPNATPTQE